MDERLAFTIRIEQSHSTEVLEKCGDVCRMLEALMDTDNAAISVLPHLLTDIASLVLLRMDEA